MARADMLTVFTYDVSSNRVRRKVAGILEDAASRVQKSVFEARMSENKAAAVAQRVASLLQPGDSLRVYCVGADGLRRSRIYGDAVPFDTDAAYWLV